jgi:hypothetical protein
LHIKEAKYAGGFTELKQSKETTSRNKKKQFYGKIIGVILIVLGIIFLYNSFSFHFKLSATLLFLGFVIILMINEKKTDRTINNIQLILIIILITLVTWLVTINADFDIFFIIIVISVIALKELLNKYLSPYLQKRMIILFCILLVPLVIIFLQRIINILSMYPS